MLIQGTEFISESYVFELEIRKSRKYKGYYVQILHRKNGYNRVKIEWSAELSKCQEIFDKWERNCDFEVFEFVEMIEEGEWS